MFFIDETVIGIHGRLRDTSCYHHYGNNTWHIEVDAMKFKILAFISIVAMSVIGSANAETWECTIDGATQKVILTQESDPAFSDDEFVKGTVTGPYGKKHKAEVSIDGFDRRWDYHTVDKTHEYTIFMDPNGQAGFIDFTGAEKGESRDSSYTLVCKNRKVAEEQRRKEEEFRARMLAEENQRRLNTQREAYILAIRQKVERNWKRPVGSGEMPVCEVLVEQGPGGIILDVSFGSCDGSTATYRASIEGAVYQSEPLPAPGDPELFERELKFSFNPRLQ